MTIIEDLIAVPEETWAAFQFARDPLRKKISVEEQQVMGVKALRCGKDAAKKIRQRFPEKSVQEILQELKVPIVHQQEEHIGSRLLFALYDSSRGILLMDKPLEKFANLDQQSVFTHEMIEDLILSHELYHHIETNDPEIYTQKTEIILWKFLGYKHRSNIRSLSEIAAMSFAKKLNQVDFSPFLLDIVLVWPYDQEQAIEMYQEVMSYLAQESKTN